MYNSYLYSSPLQYYFTGKERDTTTNLYYYGSRYYDPTLGNFLTPDTIRNIRDPQNLNPYSYCRNNPLRYIDPTGNGSQDSWSSTPIISEYWSSWSNYVTTDYFTQSVGGYTVGIVSSIVNLPIGLWNTITNPIDTIASIPLALNELKQGLLSNDIYTYSYTVGNIAGTIESSLALGYGLKTLQAPEVTNSIPEGYRISPYRLTAEGEEYVRFESSQLASRISQGRLSSGTFVAKISGGIPTQEELNILYNLPLKDVPRNLYYRFITRAGQWIEGPKPVSEGTGLEAYFLYEAEGEIFGPFDVPE